MRILGLDVGEKRIGVAISDPLGKTAQGMMVLTSQNREAVLQKLAALCLEHDVARIVVGLPLNMDGSRGPAVEAVEKFAAALKRKTGLPVSFIDERLTTRAAEKTLIDGNVRRRARKEVKDMLAAVLILDTYLSNPAG